MPTLLLGHGAILTDQQVLVPEGTTMSFWTDEGQEIPFRNVTGLLLNADLVESCFRTESSSVGGEMIHNHRLTVLTNAQRSWLAQVDPDDGSCWYAGDQLTDGIRLCEDPGPDGRCAQTGEHTCGGVFSISFPDSNIYWVSCRSNLAAPGGTQFTLGSQARGEVDISPFHDFAQNALQILQSNPDGFAAYFDGLGDDQKAILMEGFAIRRWSYQRQARSWLQQGTTAEEFYAYLAGQDQDEQDCTLTGLPPYVDDPADLRAAFEQGRFVRQSRQYLESAGAGAFQLFVDGLTAENRALLQGYPELAAAMDAVDPIDVDPRPENFMDVDPRPENFMDVDPRPDNFMDVDPRPENPMGEER